MADARAGIRASDAERGAVVDQLKEHYEAGRLSLPELEERTREAYAARTLGELDALLADLPRKPAPAQGATHRQPPLPAELGRYVLAVVVALGVWAISKSGSFWPAWVMLAVGARLLARYLGVPTGRRSRLAAPPPEGRSQ